MVFLLSEYISINILKNSNLSFPLKITCIYIVFNGITRTQVGILAGFNEFKQMAKINGVTGVLAIIVCSVFSYYYNLIGALTAALIIQIFNVILNSKVIIKNKKRFDNTNLKTKETTKKIILFSL